MKRVTITTVIFTAGFFLLSSLLVSLVQVNAADKVEPKALFEQRCSKCHSLERVNRTDTQEGWKVLVNRMKSKRSSDISEQDAEVIAKYLIENRVKK